ncbi:GNAT family N-acetyltransferase [Chloroflexota bacterium]
MNNSVLIRPAEIKDIPRLLELYLELAITRATIKLKQIPSLEDYQGTFAEIQKIPWYRLLVVEFQGEIAGTSVLLIIPNLAQKNCPWALVEHLIIDPKYQRRKLGKMLIEHAMAVAKKAGCYKIVVSSNKKRRGAHKFYRALGFEASSHGFSIYF